MIKTSKIIVNKKALCECLNLSQTQVQDLARDGILVRVDKDRYDLIKSVSGYIKRLKGQEKSTDELDYYSERARLTKAQADEREILNKIKKNELIKIESAEKVWCDAAIILRNNVLSAPSKLCKKLAPINNEEQIEQEIRSELIKALTSTNIVTDDYTTQESD